MLRLAWKLERLRGAFRLPTGSFLGGVLFHSRALFFNSRTMLMQALIYEPGLRYRCRSLGRNLRLMGPAPRVAGDGIIDIGDDVQFAEGTSLLVGFGLPERGHLEIKSHVSFSGYNTISVAQRVSIGNYCRIGVGTNIYDNDMHPLDVAERRLGWAVDQPKIKCAPVILEDDVWVGFSAIILKGVTLQRGVVVGAGAVVTESVPPFCVVAGNPGRVVKRLSEDTSADERHAALCLT